eukprot:2969644-Pleurochrysis_carterae.AAC.14
MQAFPNANVFASSTLEAVTERAGNVPTRPPSETHSGGAAPCSARRKVRLRDPRRAEQVREGGGERGARDAQLADGHAQRRQHHALHHVHALAQHLRGAADGDFAHTGACRLGTPMGAIPWARGRVQSRRAGPVQPRSVGFVETAADETIWCSSSGREATRGCVERAGLFVLRSSAWLSAVTLALDQVASREAHRRLDRRCERRTDECIGDDDEDERRDGSPEGKRNGRRAGGAVGVRGF